MKIFITFFILLISIVTLQAQQDSLPPVAGSLQDFLGDPKFHHYSTEHISLHDTITEGKMGLDIRGEVLFNRVMLSCEGELRLHIFLPGVLTELLLEELGVHGSAIASNYISLRFEEAQINWRQGKDRWLHSLAYEPVQLASIAGLAVERSVEFYVRYAPGTARPDQLEFAIKIPRGDWYYFNCVQGNTLTVSSNVEYNQLLLNLSGKARKTKISKGNVHISKFGSKPMYLQLEKAVKQ